METPKHSKIGASSCERWWNCPGSVAAVAACPPQKENPYAREGIGAHALAEQCLRFGKDAGDYLGDFVGDMVVVTEEMAEAVQVYLDVIRADMKKYNINPKDLQIEHKFHLTHIDKDAFGTNDANLHAFLDKIIIYDFKYGVSVAVDAEDNKQGLYYACGAAFGEEVNEIEIVIVQSRAIHQNGPVRRWTVSIEQLRGFSEQLKLAIKHTRLPNATLCVGPWCKKTFCPAMATCPAVRKSVENAAMVVFKEATDFVLPKPEDMTPAMLKRLLDAVPLMDAWLKSVWSYAETKANNGEDILGYKLVRGREGNRKWLKEEDVKMAFGDQCLEQVVMSVAQLEKKLGKKEFARYSPTMITRAEGKVILVPKDDPREEVTANLLDVFSNKSTDENLFI